MFKNCIFNFHVVYILLGYLYEAIIFRTTSLTRIKKTVYNLKTGNYVPTKTMNVVRDELIITDKGYVESDGFIHVS